MEGTDVRIPSLLKALLKSEEKNYLTCVLFCLWFLFNVFFFFLLVIKLKCYKKKHSLDRLNFFLLSVGNLLNYRKCSSNILNNKTAKRKRGFHVAG